MNSQEYYLNIRPGEGYAQTVKVSQGDIGRPLLFHLMDGANPLTITAGSDVIIHATKPSGLGFTEACSFSGSSVSVSSTLEMTQEFGLFPAEIVISLNDEVLATANFSILVERSPHQDGTTDGTKEELDDLYAEVNQLKEDLNGWSDDTKTALLNCFAHVAWTDEHGQDYYDALEAVLYPEEPPATLVSISAVYTQSGTVYNTDPLDSLKADLVVTATYSDGTTATISNGYTLSGSLETGTSTITVTYQDKTDTFTVTVTNGLLYGLYNQTFDKSVYGVNSEIQLLETDQTFTILFDGVQSVNPSGGVRLVTCLPQSTNYKGIYVATSESVSPNNYSIEWYLDGKEMDGFGKNSSGRIRFLYYHEAGSDAATIKWKSTGEVNTVNLSNAFTAGSGNTIICGQTSQKTNTWCGTLSKCEIFNHILSQAEMDSFFGGA